MTWSFNSYPYKSFASLQLQQGFFLTAWFPLQVARWQRTLAWPADHWPGHRRTLEAAVVEVCHLQLPPATATDPAQLLVRPRLQTRLWIWSKANLNLSREKNAKKIFHILLLPSVCSDKLKVFPICFGVQRSVSLGRKKKKKQKDRRNKVECFFIWNKKYRRGRRRK